MMIGQSSIDDVRETDTWSQTPQRRGFLVQERDKINISPALDHVDEIIPIFDKHVEILVNTHETTRLVRNRLHGVTNNDALIPIGDPVAISIVSAIISDMTGGRYNILRWNNRRKRYFMVRADIRLKHEARR